MGVTNQTDKKFNYFFGLINFVLIFCLVWLLWYVFMHPNGIMKLYTPMYGFSLVAVLLCCVVLLSKVLEFSPVGASNPAGSFPVGRGIVLTIVAFVLTLVVTYGIFWNFIGKLGVAYFSPQSIVASGGTGAEPFNARENASTAVIYFTAAFLWWALAWNVGFGKWPWTDTTRGVLSWSRLATVLLFTIVSYAVLFHPHVCYLFYPAQTKAGVAPWWASFAGTGSAFFSLGLVLCTLGWVIVSDLLWEGYPWKLLEDRGEGTFLKGLVTMVVSIVLGVILCVVMLKIMNIYWMEPFEGGQYTDAPYFRYLHAGEVSGFVILAAFILNVYFNNVPNVSSLWLRSLIRTVIAAVGGMVIWWFYYSAAATFVLGKVPGIAQPDDTPLVWTMLFLAIIMIQAEFFEGWPIRAKQST